MKAILTAIVLAFAVSAFAADTPPTEFVTQILEPTGGKIPRPKDWFYHEGHHGPVYDWMLTREDTTGGKKPYTTGVRIQTFTGIYICGVSVRSTVGHAPRHAPPSLSLGSLAVAPVPRSKLCVHSAKP